MVREKLHGRTAQGTWVQLEKTPAAFGQRKLPSLTDLRHLMDYVVYRVTRSNVGPWGLSRLDRAASDVPVARPGGADVAAAAGGRSRWPTHCTGSRPTTTSPPCRGPGPPVPAARPGRTRRASLARRWPGRAGRGLFGNSEVWVTETPSRGAVAILARRPRAAGAGAVWARRGGTMSRRAGRRRSRRAEPGGRPGGAGLGRRQPGRHRAGAARRVHHRRAHRRRRDRGLPGGPALGRGARRGGPLAGRAPAPGRPGRRGAGAGPGRPGHRGGVPAAGPDGPGRPRDRHGARRAVADPAAPAARADLPDDPHRRPRRARDRPVQARRRARPLADWLPRGDRAEPDPAADPDGVLAAARALGAGHRHPLHHRGLGRDRGDEHRPGAGSPRRGAARVLPGPGRRRTGWSPAPREGKDVREALEDLLTAGARAA